MKEKLIEKFKNRTARLVIVGQGYVGLPLAVAFAEAGFNVVGLDVDRRKVDGINAGHSHIPDVPSKHLRQLVGDNLLSATTDYSILREADAVIVCVPTPLSKTKDPDMSFIIDAADRIARYSHRGQLIVLESTTYPGTTEEIILPRITKNGYRVGEDFFLAFSPERIDPGRTDYTIRTTPKVVGGLTAHCLEVAQELYGQIIEHLVPVSSTRAAEMVKLLENTFRAVNIALVNEIAIMCNKLDLNVWEIVDAAATKPYGFMPFYPGPGLGGHCIPVDPHYLAWKLRTLNYSARFIELAAQINYSMPQYVVNKISDMLNEVKKSLNGSHILILGVAYKRDVGDVRESPALDIISLLEAKGAQVSYHDPYVPELRLNGYRACSIDLDEGLRQADCVVLVTDHSVFDRDKIYQQAAGIVDTRNAFGYLGTDGTRVRGL
jgi:UDP-N-acetyl-D-glucosamine dehydrogenase